MAQSFRDLLVWQRAVQLTVTIYRLTVKFPREEQYGLTSQIRRAAVSIPSNIAEGQGRLSTGEFKQFLGIARGSNFELQTQLEIARAAVRRPCGDRPGRELVARGWQDDLWHVGVNLT